MPSFLSGLANAASAGLVGVEQGRQDSLRAVIAMKAKQEALARQEKVDALAADDRTYKRDQDAIQNRIKGYTAGSTEIQVEQPADQAPRLRSFGDALNGGLGPFAPASRAEAGVTDAAPSLTTPIASGSLGSVPRVNVRTTEPSYTDPDIAVREATAAAQAVRDEAQAARTAARDEAQSTRADARLDKTIRAQDSRAGAQIAASEKRAERTMAAQSPKATQQMMRLSTQFDGDPIIKNAKELAQGIGKVRASASDPSAAGDLSLLYGYNKILDPGSVVRESEFATAAKSGSLPQQIQAAALRVANGQRLTPAQRADFLARAEQLARSQQTLTTETMKRHADRATRMGVDPRDVVYDPFEGTMKESAVDAPRGVTVRGVRPPTGPEKAKASRDPDYARFLKAQGIILP